MVNAIDQPCGCGHRIAHATLVLACHDEASLGILEPSDGYFSPDFAGSHRQQDAARENRINKCERVPNHEVTFSTRRPSAVGVVSCCDHFRRQLCERHAGAYRRAVMYFLEEEFLHATTAILERSLVTDKSDAHYIAGKRNHPKPSVPDQMDGDVPRHVADLVFDFAKVCEDGGSRIALVRHDQPEPCGEKGFASRGVQHQLGGENARLAIQVLCRYASPLTGRTENNIGHDGVLISSSAFAPRVDEQSFIEICPFDLVRVCIFLVQALREVELNALAGFVRHELCARFKDTHAGDFFKYA